MARFLLLLPLLLAACDAPVRQPALEPMPERAPPPVEEPAPATPPAAADGGASGDAAAALRRYYALIDAGRYADAWRLREAPERGGGATAEAFAAAFEDYAAYRATVGEPSLPAEADGALYVEVPVQIFGRRRDGSGFSSAGTVTLRRQAGEREWLIATGR